MPTILETLNGQWNGRSDWAMSVGCTAAAERVFPVINRLASNDSKQSCRKILDETWSILSGAFATSDLREELLRTIQSFPEAKEDDSHKPTFLAMRGIAVVWHAAKSLEPRAGHNELRSVIAEMIGLSADLDYKAPGPADKKSTLKQMEMAFNADLVKLLKTDAATKSDLVTRAQSLAVKAATQYNEVVQLIARSKGW